VPDSPETVCETVEVETADGVADALFARPSA
jgi:hypothetical protein